MSDSIKRQVQQTFSKSKEAYVTSKTHNNQSDLEAITAWLNPQPSWTVLDIATGGGHVAKELCTNVNLVFATDLTKDMLANTAHHLKPFTNIHYVVADAEELPFIEETFDAVTCRIAPHHFPNPSQFIKEAERVLKKGGLFLMIDNIAAEDDELDHFYNTFEKMRDPSHHRALKISEWKEILRANHFSIQKETARKKTLPFTDWAQRTLEDDEVQKVEDYFLNSEPKLQSYFNIIRQEEHIVSFSIDEWMVLYQK
ncbi:methyltransferase [Halobacillus andaensis]|uniref:Methyltransferase n=1 Tax=Halobacillus andaensis TaxID=1176239 RepID=A0A917BB30_HALAA|nr:class I SAM-dependent methyltransferase [Halobacillus andaensis]MBP2006327.1 ubiquinone/menaquinone biosynthesis C-methylase UbiE [Halobacillus andaensis]GGF34290.1 methyltransferase [Halobacillus andaensis]